MIEVVMMSGTSKIGIEVEFLTDRVSLLLEDYETELISIHDIHKVVSLC